MDVCVVFGAGACGVCFLLSLFYFSCFFRMVFQMECIFFFRFCGRWWAWIFYWMCCVVFSGGRMGPG